MLKPVSNILSEVNGNRKFTVSYEDFLHAHQRYLNLYRQAQLQLYVKGYQSDPTCFDEKEAISCLIEEGYRAASVSGSLKPTEKNIRLALYRDWYKRNREGTLPSYFKGRSLVVNNGIPVSEDPRFWTLYHSDQTYIELLYLVVYLREQVDAINDMYVRSGIASVAAKRKKIQLNTGFFSPQIQNNCKFAVCEGTLEVLTGGTKTFVPSPVNAGLSHTLRSMINPEANKVEFEDNSRELGTLNSRLHREEYGKYNLNRADLSYSTSEDDELSPFSTKTDEYERTPGYFVRGISLAQEDTLIEDIFHGTLGTAGPEGKHLKKWLDEFIYSEDSPGYITTLRRTMSEEIGDLRKEEFNRLVIEDILAVTPDTLWEAHDSYSRWVCSGAVVLDSEGNLRGMDDICSGYTGQYFSRTITDDHPEAQVPVHLASTGTDVYDFEFGRIYGEVDSELTPEFTLTGLSLPAQTGDRDELLESSISASVVEGIKDSLEYGEYEMFGPVWVPDFSNKELPQLIDRAYDAVK